MTMTKYCALALLLCVNQISLCYATPNSDYAKAIVTSHNRSLQSKRIGALVDITTTWHDTSATAEFVRANLHGGAKIADSFISNTTHKSRTNVQYAVDRGGRYCVVTTASIGLPEEAMHYQRFDGHKTLLYSKRKSNPWNARYIELDESIPPKCNFTTLLRQIDPGDYLDNLDIARTTDSLTITNSGNYEVIFKIENSGDPYVTSYRMFSNGKLARSETYSGHQRVGDALLPTRIVSENYRSLDGKISNTIEYSIRYVSDKDSLRLLTEKPDAPPGHVRKVPQHFEESVDFGRRIKGEIEHLVDHDK